ncbi:hypothetical protein PSH97_08850 [Pseudomonas cucumis]|uniref:Uncharacterized protein n=1 Tax=Pseudomonas cucumis TaxID=2954082 RepID=A0ABY9F114_9PSED|nr:hypothetical protein [Pseudomonas cucumis]WLG86610.1 hypothetical protein PSH97_08850 [Pseudomonas cucumis]
MSEALKEKVSEKYHGAVKPFTLFDQNGIQITLNLPGIWQLNPNSQEYYPPLGSSQTNAPVLVNNSGFDIQSATFTVTLNNAVDTNSTNTIANVQWSDGSAHGKQIMEFTCGPVSHKNQVMSTPKDGYSQVRLATTANNGRGQSTFLNGVSLISLTFGPVSADPKTPVNGPIVQVG